MECFDYIKFDRLGRLGWIGLMKMSGMSDRQSL